MPTALHKFLAHGSKIRESLPFAPGVMSEEGGEAQNKDIRYQREHHTRKSDRVKNLTDLYHRRLECSDPFINKIYRDTQTSSRKVRQTVSQTTTEPYETEEEVEDDFSSDDEEEEVLFFLNDSEEEYSDLEEYENDEEITQN